MWNYSIWLSRSHLFDHRLSIISYFLLLPWCWLLAIFICILTIGFRFLGANRSSSCRCISYCLSRLTKLLFLEGRSVLSWILLWILFEYLLCKRDLLWIIIGWNCWILWSAILIIIIIVVIWWITTSWECCIIIIVICSSIISSRIEIGCVCGSWRLSV